MRKFLAFAALAGAALFAAPPLAAQDRGLQQSVEEELRRLMPPVQVAGRDYQPRSIEELMRRRGVPGVSIAVIDEGRVAWASGFGEAEAGSGRPVTPDTLFQAASISKPVAAMGALALVDRGVLDLDRPVNEQLTSWRIPDHSFGEAAVTLRHLLGHTGGLTVSGFPGYRPDAPLPTIVQILDGAEPANTQPVRVSQRPGAGFAYSGGGFTVAQLLMTEAGGEDFPALMDRLVLRPLGMARSTFAQPVPPSRAEAAAVAHDAAGQALPGGSNLYPEMAAAGLWTTPADLARFALAFGAALAGREGGPIRPETARAMATPGPIPYGLGIGVDGEGEGLRLSHSGSNQGFRAVMNFYPDRGQGLIVMTNGENGGQIAMAVDQAIGRALGWPSPEPRIITPAPVAKSMLVERVGRYVNSSGRAVHVALGEESLFVVPAEGERFEIIPQADGTFVSPDNGASLRFRTDPRTERVDAILLGNAVLERTR